MIVYLLFAFLAQAHVKMYFSDNAVDLNDRPIRNANSMAADGGFSVAGPCGGVDAWAGSGTQKSGADPGDEVIMKINYNGGHKTDANEFKVRFACGDEGQGPTQEIMKNTDDSTGAAICETIRCPVDGQYPCGAPEGNTFSEGYVFKCIVPQEANNKDCTFSVLDQRDWGGCVDLAISRQVGGVTVYSVDEMVGTYSYKNAGVNEESAKFASCCCTMVAGSSDFTIANVNGSPVLSGEFDFNCPNHRVFDPTHPDYYGTTNITDGQIISSTMTTDDDGVTYRVFEQIGGKNFEFTLTDQKLFYSNVDPEAPMICDGFLTLDSVDGSQNPTLVVDSQCPATFDVLGEDSGGVSAFPFIVIIAIILIGAAIYKNMNSEKNSDKMTKDDVIQNVA